MKLSVVLGAAQRPQQVGGASAAEPRQQDVPAPFGDHQRRDAALIGDVHRGPVIHEQLHRRVRADVRGAVQGRAADEVGGVDLGAEIQHELQGIERVRLGHPRLGRHPSQTGSHHQWRGPFVGRQPGIGAGRDQRVHHRHVGVHRGEQKWRGAGDAHAEALAREPELRRVVDQPHVGIRPVRQQRLDQLQLAVPHPVERTPFLVARRLDAAQAAGQLRMPGTRGPVQRRVPPPRPRSDRPPAPAGASPAAYARGPRRRAAAWRRPGPSR